MCVCAVLYYESVFFGIFAFALMALLYASAGHLGVRDEVWPAEQEWVRLRWGGRSL